MKDTNNSQIKASKGNEMSRKEAVKTVGKYALITAAATFMVLSPKKSQAQSPAPTPSW